MGTQTYILPWPPSVNHIWRSTRRGKTGKIAVYATDKYASWLADAGWEIRRHRNKMFTSSVSVLIELCPPNKRSFDLDNKIKPILDALVQYNVLADDAFTTIEEIRVKLGAGFVGARVTVETI